MSKYIELREGKASKQPLLLCIPSGPLHLLGCCSLLPPTNSIPRHGSRRPRAGPPCRALLPPPWCRGRGGGGAGEVAGIRAGARAPRRRACRGGREDREAARGQGLRRRHRARHRLQEGTEQRARIDGPGGRAVPCRDPPGSWRSSLLGGACYCQLSCWLCCCRNMLCELSICSNHD
jgi:hypothetical protein